MPGGSRWERGCCYQYGGCQPDKDSQSDVIEAREVFRGRLGDKGLPSPPRLFLRGPGALLSPSRRAPRGEDPLPLPPSSSLPQPCAGTLGRGLNPVQRTQLGFRGEWGRLQAGLPQVSFLTSLITLRKKNVLEGFEGERK